MAVSKRLRYEILRRDNHACRYCGATAPGVKLAVDHVIPQSLGGSDKPENLVASCADCNAGKTSSMPNALVVADVDQEAFRQAAQLKREPERHHNAIALHLYMVWIWAYEKTGRYPTEEQQQWFIEETYRTLACGYSGHVDLTGPAYKAGLHNALDVQSYITLPPEGASAADRRFLATVNAIEAWASAWNGATEIRDPYVYETREAIAAIHRLLDSGCMPADATYAALRAGQQLSMDIERFFAPTSTDAKEGVN